MARVYVALALPGMMDLRKWQQIPGCTPREVLNNLINRHPKLTGRILGAEGTLHPHLIAHLDGRLIKGDDLDHLPVAGDSELKIYAVFAGG